MTTEPETTIKSRNLPKVAYALFGVMVALYLVVSLTASTAEATRLFGITAMQAHLLQLTILIPVIVVWSMALWGSLQFKAYAEDIHESSDGQALNQVATGLLWLVAGLVLVSVIQACIQSLSPHNRGLTIASNYLAIAFPLIAFGMIAGGARRLAALVRFQQVRKGQIIGLIVLALMGLSYVGALLAGGTAPVSGREPYFISDGMIVGTIILPYLLVWFLGITAAVYLQSYQRFSPGIIYRKALQNLSRGLLAIILASLAIQLLIANAAGFKDLGLQSILLLYYALILIYALGHILVVLGARSLRRIEEAGS